MSEYNDSFLTLLPRPLDSFQEVALKTTKNAVIAAGAGSGKTQVLATRFSWLIMTGQAKVDEILTLTFTNKAAAEMYQRIYQSLKFFSEQPVSKDITENHIKLAKQALADFSNAHIQTLDSYCSSIVRQCANRYGIKPDFVTGSADSSKDIKNQALIYVLQNAQNLAFQTFIEPGQLQTFAENTFASIILNYTSLATPKNYFISHFNKQIEKIVTAWNNSILGNAPGSIKSFMDVIDEAKRSSDKVRLPEKQAYIEQLSKLQDSADSITNLPELTIEDITSNSTLLQEELKIFENFKATVFETQNTKVSKIQDISTKVTPLKNQIEFYNSISQFINQYEAIKSLNILLDDFLQKVNTSKRTSGNLTFTDISELALKILLENEDIRNQEKNAYSKIMIDEFQDNNGRNRDLLYLLSLKAGQLEDNGNYKIIIPDQNSIHDLIITIDSNGKIIDDKRALDKLFFVGDEKQSIYKFRGADVSVFNELTQHEENKLIPMTNNYRSTPEIVQAFNVVFKNGNGIFDFYETPEQKKSYEAYYEKDACKKDTVLPELTKENIPIHLVGLNNKSLDNSQTNYIPHKEQIAYFMAKKIFEMGNEKQDWNNYAILCRNRSAYGEITKYLNHFEIPYIVDQQRNIFSDGVINDFYNFLRICVYPSDTNAFAAYLCSPLCGISENGVESILAYLINPSNDSAFNIQADFDKELQKELSPTDFEKFINGRQYFLNNKKVVLKQKLTTTLSELWNNKGYKYETLINNQVHLSAEHFDMLFELARQADESGYTVSWFIDQLDMLKNTFSSSQADIDTKDINYPLERSEAVQIMTIHKSKGLEFEHVFLHGCYDYKEQGTKTSYFFDEENGVSIKPEQGQANYFIAIQKELSDAKNLAEYKRLIYVGITRAIKDVYIMCHFNSEKKSQDEIGFHIFETKAQKYEALKENDGIYPFIPEDGFDYTSITPVEYSELQLKSKQNLDNLRNKLIETKETVYSAAQDIIYVNNPIPRSTPSSLEKAFDETTAQDCDSGEKYDQSADVLLKGNFTAADFGTLVHSYLEHQALGITPEEYEPEPKLLKNLTPKLIEEYKNICIKMCHTFNDSEAGKALNDAKNTNRFYKAEWAFRMFYEGTIYTGSIDLIFENADGTYSIVDYKSDTNIDAEKYIEQQKCYRIAASKILKIPQENISLQLYFLRHDKLISL